MGPPVSSSGAGPDLFHACLQEALAEAPGLIMRWCHALSDALRQQETWATSPTVKAQLLDAKRALDRSKAAWMTRWPRDWQDAMDAAMDRARQAVDGRRSLSAIGFEDLELMDEAQVLSTVQAARICQLLEGDSKGLLFELTGLLSGLQGLTISRIDHNPLRPDVAVDALRQAMQGLTPDDGVRDLWLAHGAGPMGQELKVLYRQLVHWLRQKGVKPPVAPAAPPAAEPWHERARAGGRHRPPGVAELGELVDHGLEAPTEPLSDFLTLDHLHDLITSGPMPLDPSSVTAGPSGEPALQTLAMEVVTLMLEGMGRDPRMLPPVMAGIHRMKPALLRVATEDPRFFVDRSNPARRLLDEIAQRNLAFGSESAPGFTRFLAALDDVVSLLQQSHLGVKPVFEAALAVWSAHDPPAESADGHRTADSRVVFSLLQVEQRQLLAQRVAQEFLDRADFGAAAPLVQRFLTGPWALVVAHARLSLEDVSPSANRVPPDVRYLGVVSDLIWSSQPEVAARGRSRLVRLIPGLMRTLREGLQSIEFEGLTASRFMSLLMALHEAALTGQAPPAMDDALMADMPGWSPETSHWVEPRDAVWLRPVEAAETGFMDEAFTDRDAHTDFQDTLPLTADVDLASLGPSELPGVRAAGLPPRGTWVALQRATGEWVRLQLVWLSPHGMMVLFAGGPGRTRSMSRHHFDQLRQANRIRLLATQSLVDDALDSVVQAVVNHSARLSQEGGAALSALRTATAPAPSTDLLPPLD